MNERLNDIVSVS